MAWVLTIAGLVALFAGGELLVRGAVTIARRVGLSPLLIGLTIVAGATSAPELLVSLRAAVAGEPEIAVGNVVGSNIANIALILGIGAAIMPFTFDKADIRRDAWSAMGASLLLVPLAWLGVIPRWAGALFVGLLIAYVLWSYIAERAAGTARTDWHAEEAREFQRQRGVPTAVAFVVGGVAALALGADWLVTGAREIALGLGVPVTVVSLTVVAIGTSLPEFATTLAAIRSRHPDVAVGNVLGSSIFNILSILGITALVAPVPILGHLASIDVPVMAAVTCVAGVALAFTGRVTRWGGIALVLTYAAYMATL